MRLNSNNFSGAIKALIVLNISVFLIKIFLQSKFEILSLGLSSSPKIWQPVTYMFVHGDFFHVFMNMFVLWMFGSELEFIWGRVKFIKYYFVTGIGSGLIWIIFNYESSYTVLIGASGAVYGILLAYGLMFPDRKVLIYFLFPVKVKFFVAFLGAIAFFSSIGSSGSNISHLTHLSGMGIGLAYLNLPKQLHGLRYFLNLKLSNAKKIKKDKKKSNKITVQNKVDYLLDKIQKNGYEKLTDDEKDKLYVYSKYLGTKIKKD